MRNHPDTAIIQHQYVNASEQPGQYAADRCGRQAVTAAWLWANPDVDGYLYDKANDDMGLDPWTHIVGVDKVIKTGRIVLETGYSGERVVDPDHIVFVSKRSLVKAGAEVPPRLGFGGREISESLTPEWRGPGVS